MALTSLPLRFGYGDLAPAMSEATARWHHDVAHAEHLAAINRLLAPYPVLAAQTIEEILSRPAQIPAAIRDDVRHHGGGHGNHQFMWKILGAARGTQPTGAIVDAIDATFGSFAGFTSAFTSAALALDGDGWAFLSLDAPRSPRLEIVVTRGNGNVLEQRKPGVLVCDLWEHAYRDDHAGDRAAWIDAYLQVIDWSQCSIRYERLVAGQPTP